eukprot:5617789-Alexandrium_andersonii.AAC.1
MEVNGQACPSPQKDPGSSSPRPMQPSQCTKKDGVCSRIRTRNLFGRLGRRPGPTGASNSAQAR